MRTSRCSTWYGRWACKGSRAICLDVPVRLSQTQPRWKSWVHWHKSPSFSPLKPVVKGYCFCRPSRERRHTKSEKVKGKCTSGCAHDCCNEPMSRRAKHLPELGEDKPSPLLWTIWRPARSRVGAMACPCPGALWTIWRPARSRVGAMTCPCPGAHTIIWRSPQGLVIFI